MKHHHSIIDLVINNTMDKISVDNIIKTITIINMVITKIMDSDKET
jgi:hypothetical protein